MDLHPEDVGHTTMAFQLTSPTLNETLKICIGKAFMEKGMKRFNVYELTAKGDQVKGLRGFYLIENDKPDDYFLDKDGDFDIKKLGEPDWITQEGPKKPKPKEKEVEPTKMDYVVMEDTHSAHSFYDALLRAKSPNAVRGTEEAIQGERRRVGSLFSGKDAEIVEMYKSIRDIVDRDELKKVGLPMKDIPEYAPFYAQVVGVEADKLEDAKNDVMDKQVAEGLPKGVDRDLFAELNESDLYPVTSAELYVMLHYFNRNPELSEKDAVAEFLKGVNGDTWVIPYIMKTVQEADNLQILPLRKEETYNITDELQVRSKVNDTTKFVMMDYKLPPLEDPYVKLVSFQSKDVVQSLFTKEELPRAIRDLVDSNPMFQMANDDKMVDEIGPALEPVAPVSQVSQAAPAEVKEKEEVPDVVQPPLQNVVIEADDLSPTVKLNKTERAKPPSAGPRTAKKKGKDKLAEDIANIPTLSSDEVKIMRELKFKDYNEIIDHIKVNTKWGVYCYERFELSKRQKNPSLNEVIKAGESHQLSPVFTQTYK